MAFLMFIDGVLRSHTGTPIYQGLGLYKLLNENNRVLLICADKPKDEVWLKQHKITKLDDIVGRDIPFMTEEPELRQVEYCRGQGPIDMVITSNTELAKRLLEIGITTNLFLHPSYIREEFRPDSKQGRKSWADIENEIEKQQSAFIEDSRVQE